MKRFSHGTRRFIETGTGLALNDKDRVEAGKYRDDEDVLITSNDFIEKFKGYLDHMAVFKNVKDNGRTRKSFRSTDYASIGIMDKNDISQEVYLSFLEAYDSYKNSKGNFENDAAAWSYIKKTATMNLAIAIRNKKDGMRITQYGIFQKDEGINMQNITSLFHKLDEMFMKNYEDVVTSKWQTDFLGYFLEVHMDEVLDKTFKGERNLKGIERAIIRGTFGIDEEVKSFKELAEIFKVSPSTLRSVKERAIKKLKSLESMEKIADFVKEYRLETSSWAREWENNEDFLKKVEESVDNKRDVILILSDSSAKSIMGKMYYLDNNYVLKATDKDFKFSEGDDLTDEDLDMISKRSRKSKVIKNNINNIDELDLGDFFVTYNYEANLSSRAFDVDSIDNFQIGNNLSGGI